MKDTQLDRIEWMLERLCMANGINPFERDEWLRRARTIRKAGEELEAFERSRRALRRTPVNAIAGPPTATPRGVR